MLLVTVGKNKKYKMRLIESSATDTPLPKIPYDSKISLSSSKFDKILGDVQVVSDYLTIQLLLIQKQIFLEKEILEKLSIELEQIR